MRIYEELFIVKPDAPVEEVDAYIGQVKEIITNAGGKIEKEEKWGNRKLAYRSRSLPKAATCCCSSALTPNWSTNSNAACASQTW